MGDNFSDLDVIVGHIFVAKNGHLKIMIYKSVLLGTFSSITNVISPWRP